MVLTFSRYYICTSKQCHGDYTTDTVIPREDSTKVKDCRTNVMLVVYNAFSRISVARTQYTYSKSDTCDSHIQHTQNEHSVWELYAATDWWMCALENINSICMFHVDDTYTLYICNSTTHSIKNVVTGVLWCVQRQISTIKRSNS